MTEATLRSGLRSHLEIELSPAVVLRHEDRYTAGIPDLSVTLAGFTLWFEVKFVAPAIISRDVQRLQVLRLANAGRCWYVMYTQHRGEQRTYILHPREVIGAKTASAPVFERTRTSASVAGFDHQYVADFIRQQVWPSRTDRANRLSPASQCEPSS